MANNIYRQHYTDGTNRLVRRSKKQGRRNIPEEAKVIRVNITMNRSAKIVILRKAKLLNMSFSAYLELAGILYTPELLNP